MRGAGAWPTAQVPKSEVEQRLLALRRALAEGDLDAALVIGATALYYLAGSPQDAHLVVPVDAEPVLYVRRSVERARAESPLERIEPLVSLRDLPRALARAGVARGRIGLELDVLPAARYLDYVSRLADHELGDCSPALRSVRVRKSAWEVERVRAAGRMLAEVMGGIGEVLQPGMTEIELSAEVERMLRRAGHQGAVRMRAFNGEVPYCSIVAGPSAAIPGGFDAPIVGAGPNAAIGKGASLKRIKRGEPVVVDLLGASDGYLADQTRTLVVGALPQPLSQAYYVARSILHAVASEAGPGVRASDLYDRAVTMAGEYDGFMGAGEDRVSFVGHGLGLEVDEPPFLARRSTDTLEPGMVFAVEPKFVLAEGAVGIENTYLVVESGVECLTLAGEDIVEV